jgi:hypothetical protein
MIVAVVRPIQGLVALNGFRQVRTVSRPGR